MLSVTKKFEFEAAHHLNDYDGKCANVHGHRFQLEVEIAEGERKFYKNDDMIIDFGYLKKIVNEEIIELFDHQDLNNLMQINSTSENLVRFIVKALTPFFGEQLVRVRLYETSNSYAEWKK